MPGGDGTGPAGMGPMTGRAAGYCAGYPVPGYANPIAGWGYGRARGGWGRGGGRGRGWRNWYYATGMPGWQRAAAGMPAYGAGWAVPPVPYQPPSREQEVEMLKGQAKHFEDGLAEINRRLQELETEKNSATTDKQ